MRTGTNVFLRESQNRSRGQISRQKDSKDEKLFGPCQRSNDVCNENYFPKVWWRGFEYEQKERSALQVEYGASRPL